MRLSNFAMRGTVDIFRLSQHLLIGLLFAFILVTTPLRATAASGSESEAAFEALIPRKLPFIPN